MPSQAQNKSRKSSRNSKRFTTLSFESIDRTGQAVFTEDISSSSRLPRPSFVLRQGEVIAANMPDTVKLSAHRSKIYVGLSDSTSLCSGQGERSHRSFSRERSSAATTIGRASIIDWTDASSDTNGNLPLSGELSFMLPPVAGALQTSQPPPGLDTNDILYYRNNSTARLESSFKRHLDKSPRPPPSRGFRPPQNTPFLHPTGPDEFSASIRTKVTSRSPRDSSNVIVFGGGIVPKPSNNQVIQRQYESRKKSLSEKLRYRKDQQGVPNLGRANFDLPMIDLKCIESPIANLGNLEEKGIRLVRLRRVKKNKRKSSDCGDMKASTSTETSPRDENSKRPSHDEDSSKEVPDTSSNFESSVRQNTKAEESGKLAVTRDTLNKSINGNQETPRSLRLTGMDSVRSVKSVTSTSSSNNNEYDKGDENSVIGTNREPYSTPLLPNVDTKRTNDKLKDNDQQLNSPKPSDKEIVGTSSPLSPTIQVNSKPVDLFVLTVDNIESTPQPITPSVPETQPPFPERQPPREADDEISILSDGNSTYRGRTFKRSSSLLSVPNSDISELRPRMMDEGVEEDDIDDGRHSRTIATQTSPPPQ